MAMAANEDTITVQHPESPTSRFTAVNGKEQPPSVSTSANGNGNGASRRGSDERLNGQPRITPPGQEKLTITTSTREDWVPPATSGDRHSYQPPGPYPDNELSHKRKREGSLDPNSSSANSYHSHALPSSTKQTPTTATTESDEPRQDNLRASAHSDHRDSYGPDVHYRQFIPSVEDPRNHGLRTDQWHQGYSQHQQQHTDDQIREALQGASQNMDAQQRAYMSPDNDDRSNPYGGYGNDRREMSAQSDPKKRKRNFSNRTKTGCMTCRRRKKKCDENRPECRFSISAVYEIDKGFVLMDYQATIVCAVALSALVTSSVGHGLSKIKSSLRFRFNQKSSMRIRPTLHSLRHTPHTLDILEENHCLDTVARVFALILHMGDTLAWMMINRAHQQFRVLQ